MATKTVVVVRLVVESDAACTEVALREAVLADFAELVGRGGTIGGVEDDEDGSLHEAQVREASLVPAPTTDPSEFRTLPLDEARALLAKLESKHGVGVLASLVAAGVADDRPADLHDWLADFAGVPAVFGAWSAFGGEDETDGDVPV